eukprot:TRINITY_DN60176_c0_g1_i1.p1 TRINITY_DN60176_c0_g1~~TRINITY_DN60176_c0_g1_i1.p1  ORF type:complete len:546 (+),score=104.77 TRINITY_DN60176_c0_g1_i1:183-1820(+)
MASKGLTCSPFQRKLLSLADLLDKTADHSTEAQLRRVVKEVTDQLRRLATERELSDVIVENTEACPGEPFPSPLEPVSVATPLGMPPVAWASPTPWGPATPMHSSAMANPLHAALGLQELWRTTEFAKSPTLPVKDFADGPAAAAAARPPLGKRRSELTPERVPEGELVAASPKPSSAVPRSSSSTAPAPVFAAGGDGLAATGHGSFGVAATFKAGKSSGGEPLKVGPYRLATGCDNGRIRVSDAFTGKVVCEVTRNRLLWSVAWHPSGAKIVAGGDDCKLLVFDAQSGSVELEVQFPKPVRCVAWCSSGRRVAACSGKSLYILDAYTGQRRVEVSSRMFLWAVAWSADGKSLAAGGEDKRLKVFEADTGNLKSELLLGGVVLSLVWRSQAASRPLLAAGCNDGVLRLVEAAPSTPLRLGLEVNLEDGGIRALAWDGSGRFLAVGTGGTGVQAKVHIFELRESDATTAGGTASGNGSACSALHLALRWQVPHDGYVRALSFHPAELLCVSGSDDGMLRIMNVDDCKVEREEALGAFVRAVAWSPV